MKYIFSKTNLIIIFNFYYFYNIENNNNTSDHIIIDAFMNIIITPIDSLFINTFMASFLNLAPLQVGRTAGKRYRRKIP